jgi:hypothetical protein
MEPGCAHRVSRCQPGIRGQASSQTNRTHRWRSEPNRLESPFAMPRNARPMRRAAGDEMLMGRIVASGSDARRYDVVGEDGSYRIRRSRACRRSDACTVETEIHLRRPARPYSGKARSGNRTLAVDSQGRNDLGALRSRVLRSRPVNRPHSGAFDALHMAEVRANGRCCRAMP